GGAEVGREAWGRRPSGGADPRGGRGGGVRHREVEGKGGGTGGDAALPPDHEGPIAVGRRGRPAVGPGRVARVGDAAGRHREEGRAREARRGARREIRRASLSVRVPARVRGSRGGDGLAGGGNRRQDGTPAAGRATRLPR